MTTSSPTLIVENCQAPVLRIFGPPGTGKTSTLSRRVRSTIAAYGPASVLIASFSNTAAHEIASRFSGDGVRPPARAIGTLHSHAYRSCEHPVVALDRRVISDWNEQVEPELAITPDMRRVGGSEAGGSFVSDPSDAATGDALLGVLDRLRAGLVPEEDWPPNVREFATRWTAWKRDVGAIDFTDMITGALERARDGQPAPGRPSRLIIDEAQDLTPLEVSLALAWGNFTQRLVFGLDDDQAINRWRGGDPDPLLNLNGPQVEDEVLSQSYRVPEAVRAVAERWVRRLSHRHDKVYHPRVDQDGSTVLGAAYRVPYHLNSATLIAEAVREVDAGRDVMIIAACNYMLDSLIKNLRAEGVPFHNPYRPGEARWNPLGRPTGETMTTTAERLRRYLALGERDWTGADIQAWIELIKLRDAGMRLGSKRAVAALDPRTVVPFNEIAALFADQRALEQATEPSLDWLSRCLLKDKQGPAEYPIHLARTHGAGALDRKPGIVVGTIHCSPPDEPVLTVDGYVQMGELDPHRHRLVGYKTGLGVIRGARDYSQSFIRAVNPYRGRLLTLTTEQSRTRVTPDHRVRVAFTDNFFEKWIVYLMRRGSWWRVGHCVSGHRPYRSGGLGGRLATEQADAGWILGVYSTKREACIAEATIQGRYGIPGLTFEAAKDRILSSPDLHAVHTTYEVEIGIRAKELLTAFDYSEQSPLFARSNVKMNRGGSRLATFLTEARNVLSGYMAIPTVDENCAPKSFPRVSPVVVTSEYYEGDVHSLEVLPHHHYVSGGAIVHNSVKGAAAKIVYLSPDISAAAARSMRARSGVDEAIRQFYVGLTRAYDEVRLLAPATSQHLRADELIPSDLEVFPA